MINAKRLNALAVSGNKRASVLPGAPTVAEAAYPGFDVTNTFGILAPSGLPVSVTALLNAELRKIVHTDEIKGKFVEQGLEATGSTPEEWRAVMQTEISRWARVIRDAGITVN
jgi:tripartite-type tricarboxylate transporter receptor subunit TctC